MIAYARETLFDVVDEIDGLLTEHYEELTLNKDRVKLDPMWGEYRVLEQMGRFVLFTVRDEGKLVGYAAFFVVRHLHYAGTLMAMNDVTFLQKNYRSAGDGIKLVEFAEKELRALGVDKVTYHIKFSLDWSPMLHRMGYSDEEKIVGKML